MDWWYVSPDCVYDLAVLMGLFTCANRIQPFIFGSIFALQIINLFWYFLILRILYRCAHLHSPSPCPRRADKPTDSAVFGSQLADDRSDDEDEADVADDIQEVRDEKADLRAKAEKGL